MSNIIFRKFISIICNHEYYNGNKCNDIKLKPSVSTIHLLKEFGILYRNSGNSFCLLRESEKGNDNNNKVVYSPKFEIDRALKLVFYLYCKNRNFLSFTDLEFASETQPLYYFNNLNTNSQELNQVIVDSKITSPVEFVNSRKIIKKIDDSSCYVKLEDENRIAKTYYFKPKLYKLEIDVNSLKSGKYFLSQHKQDNSIIGELKTVYIDNRNTGSMPLGVFEIFVDENFGEAGQVNFNFNFKSREVFLRYKLHKKNGSQVNEVNNGHSFKIENKQETPVIEFNPAEGHNPIVITSKTVVKLSEKAIEKIELTDGDAKINSNLPGPSCETLTIENNQWFSDMQVYYY